MCSCLKEKRISVLLFVALVILLISQNIWAAASITTSPPSISTTLGRGEVVEQSLEIRNTGDTSFYYQLTSDFPIDFTWSDSDQIGGAVYFWNDIAVPEYEVTDFTNTDNGFVQVNLDFRFPFYSQTYSKIFINTNGYITLETSSHDTFSSGLLPNASDPQKLIAAYFDDLSLGSGAIYCKKEAKRVIVQYDQVSILGDSDSKLTFQVVLEADGTIIFYYNTLLGSVGFELVGVQDASQMVGKTVVYNSSYLKDNLAVQFKPNWIMVNQTEGTVEANSVVNIPIKFQSRNSLGNYSGNLFINDVDGNLSTITVPCSMNLQNTQPVAEFDYTVGTHYVGDLILLDGSGSSDLDGTIVSYSWDLDGDGTYGDAFGSSTNALLTTIGDNIIRLKVTDNDGSFGIIEKTITIVNKPPVAIITHEPVRVDLGQEVIYDASTSYDQCGSIQSYEWDLDGDTFYDDGTGLTIVQTYNSVGINTVGLRVTDDLGVQTTTTTTVEVVDQLARMQLNPTEVNSITSTDTEVTTNFTIENTSLLDLTYSFELDYDLTDYIVGGPDEFGYYWTDSQAPNGPKYQWDDISETGNLSRVYSNYFNAGTQELPIGFSFPFYGNTYDTIYISRNGYITFGQGSTTVNNGGLPDSFGPANVIAGYMENLEFRAGSAIYFQLEADRVIVQYEKMYLEDWRATLPVTFQIVLEQSGRITFYYKEVSDFNINVVGIQNSTMDVGLDIYHYQTSYLGNEFAIRVETLPGWMSLSKNSGMVTSGVTDQITFTINTKDLDAGDYLGSILVEHNANQVNPLEIPVHLTVENQAPVVTIEHSTPYLNYPVTFDASQSVDLDGQIQSYAWDLNGDGIYDDGTDAIVTYTYDTTGSYIAYLRVTDEHQAVQTEQVSFIVSESPIMDIQVDTYTYSLYRGEATSSTTPPSFSIGNTGTQDLNYLIDYVYVGDPGAYYWTSSDMVGGPAYVWRDIIPLGAQELTFTDRDDGWTDVSIPFDFPFYGKKFNKIFVGVDGQVTLGAGACDGASYDPFPNQDDPGNLIGGLIADLVAGYTSSNIYVLLESERVIIQWEDTYFVTLQIILERNGDVTFYYKDVSYINNIPHIGIQNETRDKGLNIANDRNQIHSEMAIKITNRPYWLSTDATSGIVPVSGEVQTIPIRVNNTDLLAGEYPAYIRVHHNAPNVENPYLIPVNLTALNQEPTVTVDVTPANPFTQETVTFTAQVTDQDNSNPVLQWDTNNNGSFDQEGLQATKSFATAGDYIVPLQVTDKDGAIITLDTTVTIQNRLPLPVIEVSTDRPDPEQLITFDASGSYDPDGQIESYKWDLDGDGVYDNGTGPTIQHSFAVVDTHTVGLEVTDNNGGVQRTTYSVEVRNWPKITIAPANITQDLLVNSAAEPTLTLENTGGMDLNYSVTSKMNCDFVKKGPDAFGYIATDSKHLNGPKYVWHDISTIGTTIEFNSTNKQEQILLDFDFLFYGKSFNLVFVYPYGYLTLGIPKIDASSLDLPSINSPKNLIAATMNNLSVEADTSIHYLATKDRLIVQYTNIHFSSGVYTYQIVLGQGGEITYYYKSMEGYMNYIVSGIQNEEQNIGLTYYNSWTGIDNQLAVRFEQIPQWLQLTDQSGTVFTTETTGDTLMVPIDTIGLRSDIYNGTVEITHDANNEMSPLQVPIVLTVQNTAPTAIFTYNKAYVGSEVLLDAALAIDPDGTIMSYGWDLDGDGIYTDATTIQATKVFTQPGSYLVGLEVTDDDQEASQYTSTIEVVEPPQIIVRPESVTESVVRGTTETIYLNMDNAGGSELSYALNLIHNDHYGWIDSDDVDGPQFVWNDISGIGNPLEYISEHDSKYELVTLPFQFPFYGTTYDQVYVNSHGFLTLGQGGYDNYNSGELPNSSDLPNLIAGFFDGDLNPSLGGKVYYRLEQDLLIVQYDQVKLDDGTGSLTFQIVLEENGDIRFYYKEMNGDLTSASIGIQNETKDKGLTVAYEEPYVKDQLAVKITNQLGWMTLLQNTGTINALESGSVPIVLNPQGFDLGTYTAILNVQHNVPEVPPTSVAVQLTIENSLPMADISYDSTSDIHTGEVITYNATGSTDSDGSIVNYEWDFDGDGQYDDGLGSNATHVFTDDGDFVIGLRVTDNNGGIATTSTTVTVLNNPPVAVFTHPETAEPGQVVTFDATTSTDSDGTIQSYNWELDGDGDYGDGKGVSLEYSFPTKGTYTVGLQVIDDDGAIHEISSSIEIVAGPNLVLNTESISADVYLNESSTVTLEITNTGDLDLEYSINSVDSVAWFPMSPQSGTVTSGQNETITLTLDATGLAIGQYTTNLEITHNSTIEVSPKLVPVELNVLNTSPTASFTFNQPFIGYPVNFDATTSIDPDGSIVSYAWDLDGDGSFDDGTTPTISYTYDTLDSYTVSLQVVDDLDGVSEKSETFTIKEAPVLTVTPDSINESIPKNGTAVNRTLQIGNSGISDLEFDVKIALQSINDYTWVDSTMANGPEYDWEDITTKGTRLGASDYDYTPSFVTMNFEFPFYGETFTTIYVSPNGYITFNNSSDDFNSGALPNSSDPKNLIAGFFDDLRVGINSGIYCLAEENRTVIQYNNMIGNSLYGPYTFQIVLHADGSFNFYYKEMQGYIDSATIGIQDGNRNNGITIAHNVTYVENGLAVRFDPVKWVQLSQSSGIVPSGQSLDLVATLPIQSLPTGSYSANLNIYHNDPVQVNPVSVPLTLNVEPILPTPVVSVSPETIYINDIITFDASQSTDDGRIVEYKWDTDNNGYYDTFSSSFQRSYLTPGNYTVKLLLRDDEGAVTIETVEITVLNRKPTAVITYTPANPQQWDTVYFDGRSSLDPDSSNLSYSWDMDNDGHFDDNTYTSPIKRFGNPGTYTIGLKVTDVYGGTDTVTETIIVREQDAITNLQITNDYDSVNLYWDLYESAQITNVVVVRKTDGYPTSATDGEIVFDGLAKAVVDPKLEARTYYYGIFATNAEQDTIKPVFGQITTPQMNGKVKRSYQPDQENLFNSVQTAQSWGGNLFTQWNGSSLILGRGRSGRISSGWIYYPEILGPATGQIPNNVTIDHAYLTMKTKDFTTDKTASSYKLKLYRIIDPDNLGTPVFGIYDGYQTGLNFQYRDQRLGVEIPWKTGAANIMTLFEDTEPEAVYEFTVSKGVMQTNEIIFDVTDSIQAWVNGGPNQGWFVTIESRWDNKELLELYGSEAEDVANRPTLEVVYADQTLNRPDSLLDLQVIPESYSKNVLFQWTNPTTYIAGVKVIRKQGSAPISPDEGTLVYDAMGTTFEDITSTLGETYYYGFFTYDDYRTYSAPEVVKVTIGTPPAPVLAEPVVGPGKVTLSCTRPSAGSYTIYRQAEGEEDAYLLGVMFNGEFEDTHVVSKNYAYWVVISGYYVKGMPSNIQYAQPEPTTTPVPEKVSIWEARFYYDGYKRIHISWGLNKTDPTIGYYSIERKTANGAWEEIQQHWYEFNLYYDYDIEAGQTYEYRISAVNASGRSVYSDVLSATVPNYPGTPTDLNWWIVSGSQVNLSWSDVFNESSYIVEAIDAETDMVLTTYTYDANVTGCSIVGLEANKPYYFRLIAKNGYGTGIVETEIIRTKKDPKKYLF